MLTDKRLKHIRDWAVECGITKIRLDSNRRIVHQIANIIKKSATDDELYANLIQDYPAWSACFLNNTRRRPLLLAPWQIEFAKACLKFPMVWAMACRKTGKTRGLAAFKSWMMAKEANTRSVAFAPTADQAFVFDMIHDDFGLVLDEDYGNNPLNTIYIKNGGAVLGEEIKLANGSVLFRHGLALAASRGKFSLGEFGDDFVIDEYQLIPRDVYTSIIQPMRFDVYSKKTTTFIGTADLDANPQLDNQWDEWRKCPKCEKPYTHLEDACVGCGETRYRAAFIVDADRGIAEGCVNADEIRRYKDGNATPDEIDMYLYCRFPKQSDRFYDRMTLYSVPKGAPFLQGELPDPEPGAKYVMSVDWAKEHDRTEILVADISKEDLHYRFWKRIYPKGKDYSEQREYVKDLYHHLGCDWIVVDATSIQDVHIEGLTSGTNQIPRGSMFRDEKDRFGYHASGESNYEMHKNHKLNIVNGKIRVTRDGPFFLDWVKQHNQLQKKPAHAGRYVVLEAPRNGYKDLAIVSAMLSMRIRSLQKGPPLVEIGTF